MSSYHQLNLTLQGNNDQRNTAHTDAKLAPVYKVDWVFEESVWSRLPNGTTSAGMYDTHFDNLKYVSHVTTHADNDPTTFNKKITTSGVEVIAGGIILLTNQPNPLHNGFFMAINDFYTITAAPWATAQDTFTIWAQDFVRLSYDSHVTALHPQQNRVETSHTFDASAFVDEADGTVTFTPTVSAAVVYNARLAVLTAIPYSATTFYFSALKYLLYLTCQTDPKRNGVYSAVSMNVASFQQVRVPVFDYGVSGRPDISANILVKSTNRKYSYACLDGSTSIVGAVLTRDAHVAKHLADPRSRTPTTITPLFTKGITRIYTRLLGVDNKAHYLVDANGVGRYRVYGSINKHDSIFTSNLDWYNKNLVDDPDFTQGTPFSDARDCIVLNSDYAGGRYNGIYQTTVPNGGTGTEVYVDYVRVDNDDHNRFDMMDSSNNLYYWHRSELYIHGVCGSQKLVKAEPRHNFFTGAAAAAPAAIKSGEVHVGRSFIAEQLSMTHTVFHATYNANTANLDALRKRGLAVVFTNLLAKIPHSNSGSSEERTKQAHFHVYFEADKKFTQVDRHNIKYKALDIPFKLKYRFVYEDTHEDLSDEHARTVGKCSLKLQFIGQLF